MSIENVVVNKERIKLVVETALRARRNSESIFKGKVRPPEEDFISLIREHGDDIHDETYPLTALFLVTSLVFADDSEKFFKLISKPFLFKEHAWIFQPKEVLSRKDTKEVCSKYFRTGGYNIQQALPAWEHNCRVIFERYGGDLRNFLEENNNDAMEIIETLTQKKKGENDFRRFGPKLSRLFIEWVTQYDLYPLKNFEKTGFSIDFQKPRLFIQTNGIELKFPERRDLIAEKILTPLMQEMCIEENWLPSEVSATLWLIGSRCCNFFKHEICPLASLCDKMISRDPYDTRSLFDPTDIGRHLTSRERRLFLNGQPKLFDDPIYPIHNE
jgi:hypothetical protein